MSNKRGKQLNKYVPDYVLYDLETTGISANYDEVIEISAVKVRGGKIIDEFIINLFVLGGIVSCQLVTNSVEVIFQFLHFGFQ